MRFLCDTTCMVAAVSTWHGRHSAVLSDIGRRLDSGEELVVAGPALVEAYSVLSRLPVPHRLTADQSRAVLEATFLSNSARTIALSGDDYADLIRSLSTRGVTGGKTYDAVILACAVAASVDVVLTLSERHFRSLAPASIAVIAPT